MLVDGVRGNGGAHKMKLSCLKKGSAVVAWVEGI